VELEDGRRIDGSRYLGPATPGKTLAIFGDTAPCEAALELARGVDVMVHETTLEQAMAEKANSRGHSSSQQTAALARDAGVGTLIATHFSSRYDAEGCLRLLAECREFSRTLLAEDFMVYSLAAGKTAGKKMPPSRRFRTVVNPALAITSAASPAARC
jgi:ribonuclease Z